MNELNSFYRNGSQSKTIQNTSSIFRAEEQTRPYFTGNENPIFRCMGYFTIDIDLMHESTSEIMNVMSNMLIIDIIETDPEYGITYLAVSHLFRPLPESVFDIQSSYDIPEYDISFDKEMNVYAEEADNFQDHNHGEKH